MPRVYTILAAIIPLVAILYVMRTFDVAALAQLQFSWPHALHPDGSEDAAQLHLKPEDTLVEVPTPAETLPMDSHDVGVIGRFERRIVAVGDLHGDLGNAHKVLHMAGVVDADGNWSGDVDFFVQTGDIIDR